MLIALLRANSGKPFFQYRFNLWRKITLSKNSAIIRCYSEVMTSPFYLVKLESFTLKVCQLELKKGCQPKLLFERFGAISNIVRRRGGSCKHWLWYTILISPLLNTPLTYMHNHDRAALFVTLKNQGKWRLRECERIMLRHLKSQIERMYKCKYF